MNIIKPALLIFLIFIGKFSLSQAKLKGDVMLNIGLSRSNLYNKIFVLDLSDKLYPRAQKAATFFDLNITYIFKSKKWICKPILGFGYSPLGFNEEGSTFNDSQKIVSYYLPVKSDFASIYGGLSYTIISKKGLKIRVCQTINPMINLNRPPPVLRKAGLCTRTNLIFDVKFQSGNIWSLSPFFQTSVAKFNKNKRIAESPDYYPYCYGINVGTYFKH